MMLKGDCIEVMKAMKPNSMDAIITDPPYGLEFMGKKWDKLWDKREFGKTEYSKKSFTCSDGSTRKTNPVTRNLKNPNYKAGIEAQLWHTQWLIEAYRVLKPGGSMLVMGGTRTFHRLACAIEDSGFIIKDTLMWLYGSGFPKAQDLGKMIDKRMEVSRKIKGKNPNLHKGIAFNTEKGWNQNSLQSPDKYLESFPSTDLAKHWDGFKVGGIKPAYEPIIWAVKPPEGSYVDNVLKWGVGAVNVDECRIGIEPHIVHGKEAGKFQPTGGATIKDYHEVKGRFPANVILDEEAGRLLDEQGGHLKSGKDNIRRKEGFFVEHGGLGGAGDIQVSYGDSGGASRFFYCAKSSRAERNAGLEGMEDKPIALNTGNAHNVATLGRETKYQNNHPTVKPIKLFEYLIKLVTREGQIILDPFIGSGTTAIAVHNTGRKCVGIEKEEEYLEIAKRRTAYWRSRPRQLEMIGG